MKKIVSFIILLVMITSLFTSCTLSDISETETKGETETSAVTEEPKTLTLFDKPLSDYVIVYAHSSDYNLSLNYKNLCVTDATVPVDADTAERYLAEQFTSIDIEYEKQTAEYLSQRLKEVFGVEVPVVLDTETAVQDAEIIIGNTSRGYYTDALTGIATDNKQTFAVRSLGSKKLVFAGRSSGAMYHAVDAFLQNILADGTNNISLATNYSFKGNADLTVIACLGDSLTYGSRAVDQNSQNYSYPSVLARLLWKNCIVKNYGVPGTCMCDEILVKPDEYSYTRTVKYKACITSAAEIDVVIIMLGTNDIWGNSNKIPNADTRTVQKKIRENYKLNYLKIQNAIREQSPDVQFLTLSAKYSHANPYSGTVEALLGNFLVPYQKTLAEETGSAFFDTYTYSRDEWTIAEYSSDSNHPNDVGYAKLAKKVATLLKDNFDVENN